MLIHDARRNMIHSRSKTGIQNLTPWHVSRHLPACLGIKKLSTPCQKHTINFIYIAWWKGEMHTFLTATCMSVDQYWQTSQQLLEQQTEWLAGFSSSGCNYLFGEFQLLCFLQNQYQRVYSIFTGSRFLGNNEEELPEREYVVWVRLRPSLNYSWWEIPTSTTWPPGGKPWWTSLIQSLSSYSQEVTSRMLHNFSTERNSGFGQRTPRSLRSTAKICVFW